MEGALRLGMRNKEGEWKQATKIFRSLIIRQLFAGQGVATSMCPAS